MLKKNSEKIMSEIMSGKNYYRKKIVSEISKKKFFCYLDIRTSHVMDDGCDSTL